MIRSIDSEERLLPPILLRLLASVVFTLVLAESSPVWSNSAVSDGSLPNPTIVNGGLVTGGTRSGVNLFHSFDQFSVPLGQTVRFQPDAGIQNVITRVTGLSRSMIDGEIQSPGNFFLINPNGITFGAKSSLNIGGSFFATTAPMLRFSDGKTFGSDRGAATVLSVKVPIGVQWGSQPSGEIQNFGQLTVPESFSLVAPKITFTQASATGNSLDIQAPSQLLLNDSQLATANGGRLSLQVGDLMAQSSSIASSYVTTADVSQSGTLAIQGTGSLVFDNLSLVEANSAFGVANPGNDIQISGKSIVLRNGSTITTRSLGNGNAGTVTLDGIDRIALLDDRSGILANFTTISSATFVGDNTRSGNIKLTAPEITVSNQALIQSTAVTSSQQTGDIRILASKSIDVDNSVISNLDFSDQRAGLITLDAPVIQIFNRSLIENNVLNNVQGSNISLLARDRLLISGDQTLVTSQTFGGGQGGNVYLQGNQVEVNEGAIVSTNTNGSGQGGNLSVNGQTVRITEGGQLQSLSDGDGSSGSIQVMATDGIFLKGQDVFDPLSRFLIASISTSSASFRYIPPSQLPPNTDARGVLLVNNLVYSPTPVMIPISLNIDLNEKYTGIKASSYGNGKAGDIDLRSPLIDVRFFSLISNISTGFGDSARISIQAKTLNLIDSTILSSTVLSKNAGIVEINADKLNASLGRILASTIKGDGGIITLTIRDRLTLRGNSYITARAANFGKGGLITINNSNGFVIAEPNGNNDILATASVGQGGIIAIRSAGVFNIVPRQDQTLGNDLLASSETGIQGTITLSLPQQRLSPTLPKLSETVLDRSTYIMPSCPSIVRNNRLIVTGQGGRTLSAPEMINLLSLETPSNTIASSSIDRVSDDRPSALVEATHWKYQADGSVVLLPSETATSPLIAANCSKLTNDGGPTP